MVSAKLVLLATAATLSEVVTASPHKLLHGARAQVVSTIVRTVYVDAPAATAVVEAPPSNPVPEINLPEKQVVKETKSEVKTETNTNTNNNSGSGLKVKRGVSFNAAEYGNAFLKTCGGKCGWFHNWMATAEGDSSGASFVPTMWGEKEKALWPAGWKKSYDAGSRNFFSFNEPDIQEANVAHYQTPAEAVANQVTHFSGLPKDARIATPSVTNAGEAGKGLQWLKQFVEACNAKGSDCRFDFCNIHFYTPMKWMDNVHQHIKDAYEVCNTGNTGAKKKVWLSEFRFEDDLLNEEKAKWLTDNIAKLEATEELEAYAWYWAAPVVPLKAGERPGFMNSPTDLLADGKVYATL